MSTLISATLYSAHLKLDWNYDIYLPDQLNSNQKYPLLLILHGLYGNHTNFLDSNRIDSKPLLDELINKSHKKIIVAFVDGFNSFYIDSLSGLKLETAIIQDLLPYLFEHYPVKEPVGIGGISMGGYGAARLAMKYPTLFSAAFLISPAVWKVDHVPPTIHDSIHAFQDKNHSWSANIYNQLYPTNYLSPASKKIKFYIETSEKDTIVRSTDVIDFAHQLSNNQNQVQFKLDPFGAHNWLYWKDAIVPAYTWMIDRLGVKNNDFKNQ